MDLGAERLYPTPFANTALLPMLLLSLARQKHTPNTASVVNAEYDYVIVGAGSAGSVVASRLSEMPCVSILLLEAGKPPPLLTEVPAVGRSFWFTDIDWQYKTAPQRHTGSLLRNRQVIWPSGKTLGGSSVLNDMLYVRGNPQNYDDWVAEGAEGWSYEDVLPYFKKMEDNRDPEYVDNGYHGVGGPQTVHRPRYKAEIKDSIFRAVKNLGYKTVDPNAARQTGFYDIQTTMRAGQRCSTAKAYLVPAENRTNLDILPNAMVRKVLVKNRRAVGVQFDFERNTYEVKARREVIISAGTVNTAQLLMLSGIGPRKELERFKIPIVADLPVGTNFQDHCASNVNFELSPEIKPLQAKVVSPVSISRYIQNRTGPLGSAEFTTSLAFLKNRVVVPKIDFPDYGIVLTETVAEIGNQIGLTSETNAHIYGPYEGKSLFTCIATPLQPRSRGTVTLNSTDPYDPPVIDPNYFEDPKDIDDIVEGLKVCNQIGASAPMQKMGSVAFRTLIPGCEKYAGDEDMYLWCQVRSVAFTLSHQVGTARMGHPEDPRTVVDPQLRVKNIKGLRVVDASVMPIIPTGNTNAPTIMVAEKASDILKSTIECHSIAESENPLSRTEDSTFSEHQYNPTYPDIHLADLLDKSKNDIWKHTGEDKKLEDILTSEDYYHGKSKLKKKALSKVKAWNKEIPNVVPWNLEVIQPFITEQLPEFNRNLLLVNDRSLSKERIENSDVGEDRNQPLHQTHTKIEKQLSLLDLFSEELLNRPESENPFKQSQLQNVHNRTNLRSENVHNQSKLLFRNLHNHQQQQPENSRNQPTTQNENSQSQKSFEQPQSQTVSSQDDKRQITEKIKSIELQMKKFQASQLPLQDIIRNQFLQIAEEIARFLPLNLQSEQNQGKPSQYQRQSERPQSQSQAQSKELQRQPQAQSQRSLSQSETQRERPINHLQVHTKNKERNEMLLTTSHIQPEKIYIQSPQQTSLSSEIYLPHNPIQPETHETPPSVQKLMNVQNRLQPATSWHLADDLSTVESPSREDLKNQILELAKKIAQENGKIQQTRPSAQSVKPVHQSQLLSGISHNHQIPKPFSRPEQQSGILRNEPKHQTVNRHNQIQTQLKLSQRQHKPLTPRQPRGDRNQQSAEMLRNMHAPSRKPLPYQSTVQNNLRSKILRLSKQTARSSPSKSIQY